MTDERPAIGRLDLGALDAAADGARDDAIVAGVMTRIRRQSVATDDIARLVRARRILLAAAAVLAAIATAVVTAAPPRSAEERPLDVVADWTRTDHVPSNAELLATYHGYRP